MNTLRRIAILWLLAVLAVFAFAPAALAETSIAVVDLQKLMTESSAAVNIQEQVQAYRDRYQAEINAVEQQLREQQTSLVENQEKMSAEEFAQKKQEFEQSLGETRNMVQEKKRVLDEAFTNAMKQLRDEVLEAVAAISEERGYQIVLTRQNVVLVEKPFDITAEVMEKINASLSAVKLDIKEEG